MWKTGLARLFYQGTELGVVMPEGANFLNFYGRFHACGLIDPSPQRRMLQDYIEFLVAADRLILEGQGDQWGSFVLEHEAKFLDLIDTDGWALHADGQVTPILAPAFCHNDGIVWRARA